MMMSSAQGGDSGLYPLFGMFVNFFARNVPHHLSE